MYYWDGNGAAAGLGGAGTWDLKSSLFRTTSDPATGSPVVWSNDNAPFDEAVFSGTGGRVEIKSAKTIEVNRLTFLSDGYSLVGANEGGNTAVQFVGAAPELWVRAGRSVKLGTALLGSELTLGGGGTLQLVGDASLAGSLKLSIADGATLDFGGKALSLTSVSLVRGNLGALQNEGGTLTTTGGVTAESGTINVKLSGTGGLTKTTDSTVTIGQNKQFDYSGTTLIEAGTLALTSDRQLSPNSAFTISAGKLDMGGHDQGVKALTLAGGTITNGKLLVDGGAGTAILRAGSISSALEAFGLKKSGPGTATLSGNVNLSHSGSIVVENGLLDLAKATVNNPGNVTVTGGMFAGSGTYNNVRLDLAGGAIAPGGTGAVGSLSFGGESKWTDGSSYDFDVFKSASGISTDLLAVQRLDLTALHTGGFTVSVDLLAGSESLFSSTTAPSSLTWTFLTAQNGIAGFEAGDFTVTSSFAGLFNVAQVGNSLQLTYTSIAVPEPATYAAALGAATLALVGVREWWRRRAAGA